MANFLKSLFVKGVEIDTAGAITGDVLKYNGTKFGAASAGGGSVVGVLDDLTDVVITSPATGSTLYFDGTNWIDSTTLIPNVSDTLVGRNTTDTLTNKTLTTPIINGPTITATGQTPVIHGILLPNTHGIYFEGATTDANQTYLYCVGPTADRTITLPDASGTAITTGNLTDINSVGTLSSLAITGDLTVDTTTLKVDSTNNRVGIGTTTPSTALDVVGTTTLATVRAGSGAVAISGTFFAAGYSVYYTSTPHGFATGDTVAVTGITPSSWNRTATITWLSSTVFFFSSSFDGSTGGAYSSGGTASGPPSTLYVDTTNDRIGIGTSSPSEKLDVVGNIALTGSVVFEGASADTFETTLSVTDPTADRTIALPNASGTVALLGTIALGTDTTGNYVGTITAGTGIDTSGASTGEGIAHSISLASGVATIGTYKSVTVDTYGRVTAGTNPTTLAGYGITDAQKAITISDTAPSSPAAGNLWFKSDTGNLLVYYDSYWIDAGAPNYATLDGGSA